MFKVEAQSFEQRGEHLEISKFQFKVTGSLYLDMRMVYFN